MSLLVTKWHISCVWSMNLDYMYKRNNYTETKSVFSKRLDLFYFISNIFYQERSDWVSMKKRKGKNQNNIFFSY
jgi:hypothetical protein